MANVKFFLDTNALLYLAGLAGLDLQDFKSRMKASSSELFVTHIQVDEAHETELQDYKQKIKKALASLTRKGINVSLEGTKIVVLDVSRFNYARFGDEDIGKLYDKLRKEIDICQKAKGKPKPLLNIACDAAIAVSSLDHDFFVTTDECLYDSWQKAIGEYRGRFKVPMIIRAERSPRKVATRILGLLP